VVTAGELMKPATTTVEREAHVAAAAYLMKRAGASALVVTTDDAARLPLAIVTDADIAQVVADGLDVERTRIIDLVQRTPVTAGPETPITEAAELMLTNGVKHLPIVDDGQLVGLLDITAACQALLSAQSG
jgi:CBS domain-containing protein